MANVTINTGVVDSELKKIDNYLEELQQLYENINPNLTGGWDSNTSKQLIEPKLEEIKSSVLSMKQSVLSVREGVGKYSSGMVEADIAGASQDYTQ